MPHGLTGLRDLEDLVSFTSKDADCLKESHLGIFNVTGYMEKIAIQITKIAIETYAGFAVKMNNIYKNG